MRMCLATLLFLQLDNYWIGAHAKRPDIHNWDMSKLGQSQDETSDHGPVRSELFQQRSGSDVGERGLEVNSTVVLGSSLLSLNSSSRSNLHEQPGGHATETASSAVQQVHTSAQVLTGTHRSQISLFRCMGNSLMRFADRNLGHDSTNLTFALCLGAVCAVILVMVCCYVGQANRSKNLRGSSSYTAARFGHYQRADTDWNESKPA